MIQANFTNRIMSIRGARAQLREWDQKQAPFQFMSVNLNSIGQNTQEVELELTESVNLLKSWSRKLVYYT